MITYRNPLWNIIIQFLKELKEYPSFQESRIKNTVEDIYNKACKHAKIGDNDWKIILLTRVLPYLREKDITPDDSEVFKYIEENNFDKFCFTNKDGFEIFEEAKNKLSELKSKRDQQLQYETAYREYEANKEAHEKFISEQERTRKNLEESEKKLQEFQKQINSNDIQETNNNNNNNNKENN